MAWVSKVSYVSVVFTRLSATLEHSCASNLQCSKILLFTFHLNCKYHPWGLINDMQMSIYNRKHWHALFHSLHFVQHEERLSAHPPSPASKSGSRLPIFNSVCLGLVPGQNDFSYLIEKSWITIAQEWILYYAWEASTTFNRLLFIWMRNKQLKLIGTAYIRDVYSSPLHMWNRQCIKRVTVPLRKTHRLLENFWVQAKSALFTSY